MDPENQALIKRIVEERGADGIVVLLGAADAEAVEVAAETVRDGDPAWVGPLAGVQLGLPVLHVFEDEVKEQADGAVYEAEIGFFEMTLDVDEVKDGDEAGPRRDVGEARGRQPVIGRSLGRRRRGVGLVVPAAAAELAAVHDQRLRADEPGVVARQEQHRHRLVARGPGVLERDPRQVPAHQLALARVLGHLGLGLGRDRLAGRHARSRGSRGGRTRARTPS